MAKPVLQTCDAVGNILKGSDLGLSAGTVLATASPKDLTPIQCPVPETMLVLVRNSSGSSTVTVDVSATNSYSSADYQMNASSVNVFYAMAVDTTEALSFANIRIATTANVIMDRFAVVSLSKLTAGEEFRSVRSGRNAVAPKEMTSGSDGSGVWSSDLTLSP